MLKRFLLYGLPLYLILVEQFVRMLLHYVPGRPDEMSLAGAGSSIAVAGIALLCPVLVPKPPDPKIDPKLLEAAGAEGINCTGTNDQRLINSAVVFLFLLTALWGYGLWLGHNPADTPWNSFDSPVPYGCFSYLVGIVHTELKDFV